MLKFIQSLVPSSKNRVIGRLEDYTNVFEGIKPWAGHVPKDYIVDFLGVLTHMDFRRLWVAPEVAKEDRFVQTSPPPLGDGTDVDEFWFEAANWCMAARESRGDRFVMMTLGANYGYQATGACAALKQLNPKPFKLVAVDPGPENCEWTARHFRDNGIPPDDQWILQMAVSDSNDPVFFPVGGSGTGANSSYSANADCARNGYLRDIIRSGKTKEALSSLLLRSSTGIVKNLAGNHPQPAEIKMVSAVTLGDLLRPFDRVDYIEADMQQAEEIVFEPYIDLLKRKVKRLHIGTHGKAAHDLLYDLFEQNGWDIQFSFEGDNTYKTKAGTLRVNDGVLTVINPDL